MVQEILNELIEKYRPQIINKTISLVGIDSTLDESSAQEGSPFGKGIRKAADYIIDLANELGLKAIDYDGYAVAIRSRELDQCFEKEKQEAGVLSHLDVVPVGDGWRTDPFIATITDSVMYGRGTVDDKGPTIASIYAFKAVIESGLPIKRRYVHIMGCDEETGHRCIRYYLQKERGPDFGFSPDASFPVIHAEKGILRFNLHKTNVVDKNAAFIKSIHCGSVVNIVPNKAKVVIGNCEGMFKKIASKMDHDHIQYEYYNGELAIIFDGVSAHSMQPWEGDNAIEKMLAYLVSEEFSGVDGYEIIHELHELFEGGWKGTGLGIACEEQLSGKLTVNLGVLNYDHGVLDGKVDVRCPVHNNLDTIWRTIKLTSEKYGYDVDYWQMREPLYVPKETPFVQSLLEIYNEMTGSNLDADTIGGGTYCRDLDNFVSFGPVFPGQPELAHQANECIGVEDLILCAKLYAQAIYSMLQ